MPKKKKKPKQKYTKWMVCKLCIKNVALNEFLLIFFII
jgi:hypothetical protein